MTTTIADPVINSRSPTDVILQARSLTKHYRSDNHNVTAFQDLSLSLHPGEIVCLLGPSGCGKSSLLQAIACLQSIDAGEIQFLGQPLHQPHPRIGFVFQEPALLPWQTVWQNVSFGLELKQGPQLSDNQRRSRISEALERVGLAGSERAYPRQLSGGMAQRVALARALARHPHLLLLDEPFAALDAIHRLEMQKLLLEAIAGQTEAVLMVTHDLDEALLLGDRVILMHRNPGRFGQQWIIPQSRPRFHSLTNLSALRAEILQALSDSLTP